MKRMEAEGKQELKKIIIIDGVKKGGKSLDIKKWTWKKVEKERKLKEN